MSDLRKSIIRLAHAKPELRVHLLPLLKSVEGPSRTPSTRRVGARGRRAASWNVKFSWRPTEVDVTDERGTVDGSTVTIETAAGDKWSFDVIPPEGHIQSWLGEEGEKAVDELLEDYQDEYDLDYEEIIDTIEEAAKDGPRGRRGQIVWR